jgi:hypothetical protein
MGLQAKFSQSVTKLPKELAVETIAFGQQKTMESTYLTVKPTRTSSCTDGESEEDDVKIKIS